MLTASVRRDTAAVVPVLSILPSFACSDRLRQKHLIVHSCPSSHSNSEEIIRINRRKQVVEVDCKDSLHGLLRYSTPDGSTTAGPKSVTRAWALLTCAA